MSHFVPRAGLELVIILSPSAEYWGLQEHANILSPWFLPFHPLTEHLACHSLGTLPLCLNQLLEEMQKQKPLYFLTHLLKMPL